MSDDPLRYHLARLQARGRSGDGKRIKKVKREIKTGNDTSQKGNARLGLNRKCVRHIVCGKPEDSIRIPDHRGCPCIRSKLAGGDS